MHATATDCPQLTIGQEKELLKAAAVSIEELMALMNAHPGNVHYMVAAARVLGKRGDVDHAEALYAQATKAAPTPLDASYVYVAWATHKMHLHDDDAAQQLLDLATEVTSTINQATLNARARLAERQGKTDLAKSLYREALEAEPRNSVTSQALAVLLSREGDSSGAEALFKAATEANPTDAATWSAWALHEWRNGRYAQARAHFEQGIQNCRPHAPLLVAYAKMEAQRRHRTKARALLREATAADPGNPHTWVTWAQLEGRAGNATAAVDICTKALQSSPGNTFVLCTLGQVHAAAGDSDRAVAAWKEALTRDPECAIAAHELGNVAQKEGNFEAAEGFFMDGARSHRDPKGALRCAASLAEARAFRGDASGAREALRTASNEHEATANSNGRFLRSWAAVEKRLGDLSASSALFRRAAAADARDERTWLQWGQLERRRGDIETALHCWKEGLKVSPLNPFLWQLYGGALWDMGQQEEARVAFKEGVRRCMGNQPLLLEWALKEASAGDAEAALGVLRLAKPQSSEGLKDEAVHVPLLAAWVRLAGAAGRVEEAAEVQEKLDAAIAAGGGPRGNPKKGGKKSWRGGNRK